LRGLWITRGPRQVGIENNNETTKQHLGAAAAMQVR
jgi:hypothetical protein